MPLHIVFVSSGDPGDVGSFSGVLYHMVAALKAELPGLEVVAQLRPGWFHRLTRVVARVSNGKADTYQWRFLNAVLARRLSRRWRGRRVLAISVVNSGMDAALAKHVSVLSVSDTTFRLMRGFYAAVDRLGDAAAREGERSQRESIAASVHCSFSSRWAADSAIEHYGAAPASVSVIAWGCNLPDVPASSARFDSDDPVCRLLFVGGDWQRKGGDLVAQTIAILRDRGIPCSADLVGAGPPDGLDPELPVTQHGFLNKARPDDFATLSSLYRDASLLFLPTRQDCTPMIFAEANAYGTPGLSRDVGGVNGVIEDGVNGLLLHREATPAEFADAVIALWGDRPRYAALRRSARATYETRLNWAAWARSLAGIITDLEERKSI